jgi:hypothetical protein
MRSTNAINQLTGNHAAISRMSCDSSMSYRVATNGAVRACTPQQQSTVRAANSVVFSRQLQLSFCAADVMPLSVALRRNVLEKLPEQFRQCWVRQRATPPQEQRHGNLQ